MDAKFGCWLMVALCVCGTALPAWAQTQGGQVAGEQLAQQLAAERNALQVMLDDPNTPAERKQLIQTLLEWNARGVTIAEVKQRQAVAPPVTTPAPANNLAEAEAAPLPANLTVGGGSMLQNFSRGRDAEVSSKAASSLGLVKSQQEMENAARESEAKLRDAQNIRNQAGASALAQRQQDAASAASQQAATGIGAVMGDSLVQSVQQGAQAAGQAIGGGAAGRVGTVAGQLGGSGGAAGGSGGGTAAGGAAAGQVIFGGGDAAAGGGMVPVPAEQVQTVPAADGSTEPAAKRAVGVNADAIMALDGRNARTRNVQLGDSLMERARPLTSASKKDIRVVGSEVPPRMGVAGGATAAPKKVAMDSGRGMVTCGRCKAPYRCDMCANPDPNVMSRHMHLCSKCQREDMMYMNCPKHGRVGRSREGCPQCYNEEIRKLSTPVGTKFIR